VTGVAGCRYRRRHKYTLKRKRDRRRQHHRDSHMRKDRRLADRKKPAPQHLSKHGTVGPVR
jgi:hypothetical protein